MKNQIVHVMLKPDTLKRGIRDAIVRELEIVAGPVFVARRMRLSLKQIEAIYRRFPNPYSKEFVFKYFTSQDTEHLAFIGSGDLHGELHKIKGGVRSGTGIRGKYFANYIPYTKEDVEKWLQGTSSQAEEIDLEMFGRDILHVADNQEDSIWGLQAVLGPDFVDILRAMNNSHSAL